VTHGNVRRAVKVFSSIERSAPASWAGVVAGGFSETLFHQHSKMIPNLFIRDADLGLKLDGAPRTFA
jgi:hypothetical protein